MLVTKNPRVSSMLSMSVCQSGNRAFHIHGLPDAGFSGQTTLHALPLNSKSYLTNPFHVVLSPGNWGIAF